jgi:hypothetical protein
MLRFVCPPFGERDPVLTVLARNQQAPQYFQRSAGSEIDGSTGDVCVVTGALAWRAAGAAARTAGR